MALLQPTDLPGLAVWMDAPSLGFPSNQSVPAWPPIVGPGVVVSILGSPQPQYKLNQQNALPIVRFRANQGVLRATMPDTGTDYTTLGVGRMGTGTNGRLFSGLYTPNNWLMGWWSGFEDVAYAGGFIAPGSVPASGAWRLYALTQQGANGSLWRFGAADGSTGGLSDRLGPAFNFSGYAPYPDLSETADCEVAEWLVFTPSLSTGDRQKAEGYLAWRWGLQGSLPVDHPYAAAAPVVADPSTPVGVQAYGSITPTGLPDPSALAPQHPVGVGLAGETRSSVVAL